MQDVVSESNGLTFLYECTTLNCVMASCCACLAGQVDQFTGTSNWVKVLKFAAV